MKKIIAVLAAGGLLAASIPQQSVTAAETPALPVREIAGQSPGAGPGRSAGGWSPSVPATPMHC